jgi:hypothetical protein
MKQRLTRRSLLAAAPGGVAAACLIAAPRPARADALSMDGLLAINDDDNAVMDALTDKMWNAPALVTMAYVSNASDWSHHINNWPQQRTYSVDFAAPGPAALKIDDANYDSFSATLATLFALIDAAEARPDVRDFVNIATATTALNQNVRVPFAQQFSELVYLKLLQLSRPKNSPGAPLFTAYSGDWGDRLAATLQSTGFFIQEINAAKYDSTRARRNLSLQLYKLKQLKPNLVPVVVRSWQSHDLDQTIFPLAAKDPWPPNYYDMMVQTKQKPLKALVDAFLATHTVGSHQECVPVTSMFGGEESCANVDDDYYGVSFVEFLRGQAATLGVAR